MEDPGWIKVGDKEYFGYLEVVGDAKIVRGVCERSEEADFKMHHLSKLNPELIREVEVSGPVVVITRKMREASKRMFDQMGHVFIEAEKLALYEATKKVFSALWRRVDEGEE